MRARMQFCAAFYGAEWCVLSVYCTARAGRDSCRATGVIRDASMIQRTSSVSNYVTMN